MFMSALGLFYLVLDRFALTANLGSLSYVNSNEKQRSWKDDAQRFECFVRTYIIQFRSVDLFLIDTFNAKAGFIIA
jgi:hypothetical protein